LSFTLKSVVIVFDAGSTDAVLNLLKTFNPYSKAYRLFTFVSADMDRSFSGMQFAVQFAAQRYPELSGSFETDNLIVNESCCWR